MNERDLREALAPLQGDPVQDAARVLAALPPGPPGAAKGKPLPPLTWWLLGSGLVFGAVVGLWLGRGTAPAARPEVKPAVPAKAEEPVKPPPPAVRDEFLYLMAEGKVQIDEPGFGIRNLERGSAVAAAGTTVTTEGKSHVGCHVLRNDAKLHFDEGTVATIAVAEIQLRKGRVSVTTGSKGGELRVVSDLATVQLQQGNVVVHRQASALAVQAVYGEATVRTASGQTARLGQGLQVLVDAARGIGEPQKIPAGDWALTWMNQWQGREGQLELMAFGRIHIDEPGEGPQDLAAGGYVAALGTTVTTDSDSQAGLYLQADDSRVRVDHETVATVDVGVVRIKSGRVWACTGARETEIRIESDLATILCKRGEVIAVRQPEGLAVVAINGEAIVRTQSGQTAKLSLGLQVFADPDRGLTGIQKVPFLGTATSWMTDMILQGRDEAELKARVNEMVDAFTEGSQRPAAAIEIRKLGARCTGGLVESIGKRPLDRDHARAAAAVAAAVSDYRNTGWLFQLLEHDDAEVRVLGYRGIARVTSTDGGTDETFWRTAAVERRRALATTWWKSLK